jgi:hypothetical protein
VAFSVDSVGAFVIRELTGDKRELRLVDRALPYRPLTLEGVQDNEATKYAGNPVRSLQVFGPSEKDTTIKGFWKDIFIGDAAAPAATVDGRPLLSARVLSDLVDDVREKGQLVEVTWLHEQRQGIIGRFKKDWHNLHDLEWEIDFVWAGKSKNVLTGAARVLSSAIQSASALVSGVASKVNDFVTKSEQLDQSSDLVEEIRTKANSIRDTADSLLDQADNAAQNVVDQLTAALGIAGQFQGIVLDAGDVVTAAYSRAEAAALGLSNLGLTASAVDKAANADEPIPPDVVGVAVAASEANREVVRSARQARFRAAHARDQMLRSAEPNLLAAFTARQDQDLRDVSLRYYGTAEHWRDLMTFNGFGSSRLLAGNTVFVPRLSSESAK